MKKILSTLSLIALTISLQAQNLHGDWNGKLNVGLQQLPLVLHITSPDSNPQCVMDSPNQGAKNIPTVISFLGKDSIAITVPTIGAAFQGKLHKGILKGQFSQAGMNFKLDMQPGDYTVVKKQTPLPPYPYPTEEVTFTNPTDNAVLSGTLTYPIGYIPQKKVPVVLMVTGSGLQNRDEELMGHKPFAVIADYLAKMGIASLRYDDRGFGKSTGETAKATTRTFLSDALTGINYLKERNLFSKIGMLGHSEGGLIAFMAAGENPKLLDFIVSLAGTAVSGDHILIKQNEKLLQSNLTTISYSDDYCKVLEKIFHHKNAKLPVNTPQIVIEKYIEETKTNLPATAVDNLKKILINHQPWLDFFLSYNPTSAISQITCPVMAINGDRDIQVDASINIDALHKSIPTHPQHLIKIYPGLNHLFQHCTTGHVGEYATIEETISPEVLKDVAQWILGLK